MIGGKENDKLFSRSMKIGAQVAEHSKSDSTALLPGFGVWIVGHDAYPVAIFRYQEQAEEWGRCNYHGQWLTKPVDMPMPPLFSEDEWATAEKESAELIEKMSLKEKSR